MADVFVGSDLHFNHINMAKWRGFKNVEDMNELIIFNWNNQVRKRDVVYLLGDITMEKKAGYELLDRLNGTIHVVLGNHDRRQDVRKLLEHVETVSGAIEYKKTFFFTHIPVHPRELSYRRSNWNVHGHVHENTIKKTLWDYEKREDIVVNHPNYFNACMENINYTPIALETIREILTEQNNGNNGS